ncbi:MAG: hypothetical protein K6E13_09290 [Lachnospiraceae bacterium]|nr:hypothetical protein [Lachnospiraceae bacterium]
MDWIGLIFNVVFLFVGLAAYLIIYNKIKGNKYEKFQYAIMAVCILGGVIIGGILRKILGL